MKNELRYEKEKGGLWTAYQLHKFRKAVRSYTQKVRSGNSSEFIRTLDLLSKIGHQALHQLHTTASIMGRRNVPTALY